MSFVTAAAIGAGGALAGGYLSGEASKDAAAAGADASGRASAQVKAAADQARREVKQYIPAAQRDVLAGYQAAGDIFSQAIPEQQRLLSGGNLAAQQTTAGGYDQYRSALLGLPVDQANWAPRQVAPSAPIANPVNPGMFTDLGAIPAQAQQEALSNITSNRDVLAAISSGELDIPNVDKDFWTKILRDERSQKGGMLAPTNNAWMEAARSQEGINRLLAGSGFNPNAKGKLANLLSQLNTLQGGI